MTPYRVVCTDCGLPLSDHDTLHRVQCPTDRFPPPTISVTRLPPLASREFRRDTCPHCRAVIESPIERPGKHRASGPASLAAQLAAPHRRPAGHDRFADHVARCRKGRP